MREITTQVRLSRSGHQASEGWNTTAYIKNQAAFVGKPVQIFNQDPVTEQITWGITFVNKILQRFSQQRGLV